MSYLTSVLLALCVSIYYPSDYLLNYIEYLIGGQIPLLDFLVLILVIFIFPCRVFNISRLERSLFFALLCVVFTRIISLLNVSGDFLERIPSVLRYFETGFVIYVFSAVAENKLAFAPFISAMLLLTTVEATLGIYMLVFLGQRGIALSISNLTFEGLFASVIILKFLSEKLDRYQIVCGLLCALGLLSSLTRSAIIMTMISIALSILKNKSSFRALRLLIDMFKIIPLALIVVVFFHAEIKMLIDRFETLLGAPGSGLSDPRFAIWAQAWGLFLEHPWTGIGSGSFARLTQFVYAIPDWVGGDYAGKTDELVGLGTHSTLMNIMVETGLAGLVAYLIWFRAVINICLAGWRIRKDNTNEWALISSLSVFILIITCLDIIEPGSFFVSTSIMTGMLLGLIRRNSLPSLIHRPI